LAIPRAGIWPRRPDRNYGLHSQPPYVDQHDESDENVATGHLGLLIVGEGLADGEARGLPGGCQAGEDRSDGQD
jgi:hypothetical protein